MSNVFVFRRPPHGVITEYFGGGKGGSSTTTNNLTQIPPEVLARYNAVNARAEAVAQQPYQAYSNDPNAFVAPLNATQQAGIQNTNIMAGAAQPYYQSATNQLMQAQAGAQPGINAAYQNVGQAQQQGQNYLGAATAAGLAGAQAVDPSQLNINQYMNPYTQSVVNATQAAMNQQQGQQLAQQQAEAIRSGAFGGERAGLQRGQLRGQQSLAQAQAIAPLYQQNYNQALAAAQQQQGVGLGAGQANRAAIQNYAQQLGNLGQQGYQQGIGTAQQQAALAQQGYGMGANTSTLLGSIGTNAQQAGLAGAQAQLAAGQQQQQTQQAGLQALYNQFQQQQGFPYQQAQFLANIATGTGALSGNASSGTSTTTGGGGFFSDERLKENIKKVGETNDGQPIYRYNYKGDQRTQIGLLAQDVEKDHPEAVGLAGGYKTVDYKKATEDAVHKAEGGAATDAYAINPSVGNSQMLQENSGKGLGAMPSLPQMITGPQRIEAGANAAQLAAMRAPQTTGYSLGTREGKEAELASLQSSLLQPPGPNGDLLGSGPQYLQSRISTLQDWLNKNNSQGGLVGPQGGSFARGGLAEGDYMNPALAYYSPQQAQQGVFQLQPMPQRQILQGTPMQAPQQRQQPDAITSANQMAGLVGNLNSAYKARPDFLRSAEDVAARQRTADALAAKEQQYIDWAKEKGYPLPSDKKVAEISPEDSLVVPEVYAARGGLIGDRDHYSRGGINPYGGLGGNDILGPIIEEQDTSRRLSNDKVTPPPAPKQQSSGLGELAQMANAGKSLYKGGEWAAGKLGLGAPETAMSATSTGIAGAAPEALSAGLAGGAAEGAALAGGAEAATAAGLAGGAEALGGGLMAAGSAALPFVLPAAAIFSLFAKDGGAIKGRDHYQAGGLKPPTEDAPVVVEEVPLVAEGGNETAQTGGGETVVRAGLAPPIARPAPRVPGPEDAVVATTPRAREPGVAPASRPSTPSKSFLPEITSEGVRDTLSSENFWVPAIAGLGSMLASPNKTLAGAIGSGLVGGTGAYTGLQKQQSEIAKNSLDIFNKVFEKREDGEGNISYMNLQTGKFATPQEAFGFLRNMPGFSGLAKTPTASAREAPQRDPTVALASDVVDKGVEPVTPRAAAAPPVGGAARPAATAPAEAPAVTPGAPAAGTQPAPSARPTAAAKPEEGEQPTVRIPEDAQAEILKADAWARSQPDVKAHLDEARIQSRIADQRQAQMRQPISPEKRAALAKEFEIANTQAREATSRAEATVKNLTAPILADIGRQLGVSTKAVEGAARLKREEALAVLDPEVVRRQAEAAALKTRSEETEKARVAERVATYVDQETGTEYTLPLDENGKAIAAPPVRSTSSGSPAPKKAEIEPLTRAVIAGRPKPPPGGGTPLGNLPGNASVKKLGDLPKKLIEKDAEYYADMLNKSEAVTVGSQRYNTITNAFKLFQSGPGAAPLSEYAAIAKSWGAPDLAEAIFKGKPEAVAVLQKQAPGLVLEQLKAATPRFAQSEFTALLDKAVPDAGRLPEANFQIVAEGLAIMNRSHAFLDSWADAQADGWRSMSAYYLQWSKANPMPAYLESAKLQMGNFAGMPIPPADKLAVGATYVTPKELDGETKAAMGGLGIQPGDIWRYNGRDQKPTIIPQADMFSVYMGY